MTLTLPSFTKARVLVIGDVMLDRYWSGGTGRISPEAPVPVVHVNSEADRPGGAANVALNLAALGCQVSLLGLVGTDPAAEALRRSLSGSGVQLHLLAIPDLATITKLRVISRNQQLIRLDFEGHLPAEAAAQLITPFNELLAEHDLVLFSDYAKGSLQQASALIQRCRQLGIPALVDPKQPDAGLYAEASLLTPNLAEFEAMVGRCTQERDISQRGMELLAVHQLEALLITRGEQGLTLLRPDKPPFHQPSQAREVFDVTGAGDTVIATMAACLAAGSPLESAVRLANLAAGLVVARLGTAAVTAQELTAAAAIGQPAQTGAINEEHLHTALQQARARGERIVLTNGCFDILHAGHVHLLHRARELGDRLVVAINSDASVQRLKGNGRPINTLERRLTVLSALSCVDWVVSFEEDTPERLIGSLLPDVLVKGADYRPAEIAGAAHVLAAGGEVCTIELVDGVSSTAILAAGNPKTSTYSKETDYAP
jgi:D-beta-D-heptose 7-phosphate kinase/D-beta-D-heptose 1-phosphate adenosyltransferase